MASLKDIKSRIGGVKKTRQITSAMKLVAGAKLKKATDRAVEARPYQERLTDVLGRVAAQAGEQFEDPLLEQRDEVNSIFVAYLTTDRGLCGPFNNNMLRQAVDWMNEKQEQGIDLHLHIYGRKGVEFLGHRGFEGESTVNYDKTPKMDLVRPLANQMTRGFENGEFDQAWVVYNTFVNTMTQTPNFRQVVPLVIPEQEGEISLIEHRYEPSPDGLLGQLLPLYLRTLLLQAFLETEAGEHAARMTAMDNATRNATELIDDLTLEYNRARQAAITTEIIEIVSGAEALK